MHKFRLLTLLLALAGFAVPAGFSAEPVGPPATASDSYAQDLLSRLNSADPAQREQAQRQLAAIAGLWQQPDLLRQLSGAATDGPSKAVLVERLAELEARAAPARVTLAPISLRVQHATLAQVATALNAVLDTPDPVVAGSGDPGEFTVDLVDKPFWEVMKTLSQQHPLLWSVGASGPHLESSPIGMENSAIDGAAMAWVRDVAYHRGFSLQSATGTQPARAGLKALVEVTVDPRLRIVRREDITMVSAIDDAGNVLNLTGVPPPIYLGNQTNHFSQVLDLAIPPKLGKTFNLTCRTRVTVEGIPRSFFVEDVQNNLLKPLEFAHCSMRVTRCEISAQNAVWLQVAGTSAPAPEDTPPPRFKYILSDGNGNMLWSGTSGPSLSTTFSNGTAKGPYRLEIRVPETTTEIPFRFELRNIPLP